ncbi:hypothetical protein IFM89_027479 [Coptis chinensis]|uniref:Uncharacterized protein n=1 Tax=Coptis chinensis TaxID=261450 RepID=A0A835I5R6_9MAGN|nr:hypothetical protein IFM89_027479 [Coptis chinensis]
MFVECCLLLVFDKIMCTQNGKAVRSIINRFETEGEYLTLWTGSIPWKVKRVFVYKYEVCGKKIYFEDVGIEFQPNKPSGGSSAALAIKVEVGHGDIKKGRGVLQGGQPPRCQVEGCKLDSSDVKAYYSRHKVRDVAIFPENSGQRGGGFSMDFTRQPGRDDWPIVKPAIGQMATHPLLFGKLLPHQWRATRKSSAIVYISVVPNPYHARCERVGPIFSRLEYLRDIHGSIYKNSQGAAVTNFTKAIRGALRAMKLVAFPVKCHMTLVRVRFHNP